MERIGYIVSKHKINNLLDGIELVKNMDSLKEGYPYLIVGLEEARNNISNFNILKHKVDDSTYWTFWKTERRNDYEKYINIFYEDIINNIIKNIKYYYINILTIQYNKFKKLMEIIDSSQLKYIYINNDMIYIYVNGYILGISLKICKYCGISEKKIITRLSSNKNNIITRNKTFLSPKMLAMISDKNYLIPYFMSKK